MAPARPEAVPGALGRPSRAPAPPPSSRPAGPAPEAAAPVTRISVLAPAHAGRPRPARRRPRGRAPPRARRDHRGPAARAATAAATRSAAPTGRRARPGRRPLGQPPVDPRQTLDGLGVLDGDQLVLRRRAEAAPAPLYDDVVDAVAESTPASYRPWDADWAHALGLAGRDGRRGDRARRPARRRAAARGRRAAWSPPVSRPSSRSSRRRWPPRAPPVLPAGPATVLVLLATGAAAVCGLAVVPGRATGHGGAAHRPAPAPPTSCSRARWPLVTAGSTLLGTARARPGRPRRPGRTRHGRHPRARSSGRSRRSWARWRRRAGRPSTRRRSPAGAGAVALVVLSALPRLGIALARLPLPRVPASPPELADDAGPADPAALDRRADRAHALLAGLAGGVVTILATAAAALAMRPPRLAGARRRGPRGPARGPAGAALPQLRQRPSGDDPAARRPRGRRGRRVGAVAAAPGGAARVGLAVAAVAGARSRCCSARRCPDAAPPRPRAGPSTCSRGSGSPPSSRSRSRCATSTRRCGCCERGASGERRVPGVGRGARRRGGAARHRGPALAQDVGGHGVGARTSLARASRWPRPPRRHPTRPPSRLSPPHPPRCRAWPRAGRAPPGSPRAGSRRSPPSRTRCRAPTRGG